MFRFTRDHHHQGTKPN